jgi:hypothetical protein
VPSSSGIVLQSSMNLEMGSAQLSHVWTTSRKYVVNRLILEVDYLIGIMDLVTEIM